MRNERYYYHILPPKEKIVYEQIFAGLKEFKSCIFVDGSHEKDRITDIYFLMMRDEPMFFYVNNLTVDTARENGMWKIFPTYLYTQNEAADLEREIKTIAKKIYTKALGYKNDEFSLERYFHDSAAKSVAYDYDFLIREDNCVPHTLVGAYIEKRAVCDGISKAFKLLCNMADIKCIVALGYTDGETNIGHAWNLVKVRNQSYHVDVTWDALTIDNKRYIKYDYFNVTTEEILRKRKLRYNYPVCSDTALNYHYHTNSFVGSYAELIQLLGRHADENIIRLRVKKDKGEFLTKEEITNKIIKGLNETPQIGPGITFTINVEEALGAATIIRR